jgi:hypothetical protein
MSWVDIILCMAIFYVLLCIGEAAFKKWIVPRWKKELEIKEEQ